MSSTSSRPVAAVPVGRPEQTYPVLVGNGLRARIPPLLGEYAPGFRYAVISDDRVAELYGRETVDACRRAGLKADLYTFPEGEASKTRDTWSTLTDALLSDGLGRDAVVVAVGGGVTGDLAGFVAATYLRGIPVVQVPTSLVAMIDASVGGKTGVDVPWGKNLVGAFHRPRVVIADPETVKTLPEEERAQGLAEALKHGAILDRPYFEKLTEESAALMAGEPRATYSAVLRSVELKARIVSDDEREEGRRQVLNFGHTLGHALEAASDYEVGHGSAVAAGMVLEAGLGERLGVTEAGTREGLGEALSAFGLGSVPSRAWDLDSVLRYLIADKKVRSGRPRYVLLERLGVIYRKDDWSHEVPDEAVREVLLEALHPG